MGVLDEEGRPIRGAGALPYEGFSGGTGDMSGVTFARNIMERPPSQNSNKGEFLDKFNQLIESIQSGEGKDPVVTDVSGANPETLIDEKKEIFGGMGETLEERQRRRLAAREQIKAATKLKRQEHAAKMRAIKKAKREALKNGGAVAVSEPEVSERDERAEAGSVEVRGDDEGSGVSPDGMPDVSRAGSGGGAGVPEVQQNGQARAQNNSERLSPEQFARLQQALIIASQPFHVNPQMFAQMPLEQAENLLSELHIQAKAIGDLIQGRRQSEILDDGSRCTWCKAPFNKEWFARHPFELEIGSNQWRAIYSCRKAECLAKQNAAVEEIGKRLRAERGA